MNGSANAGVQPPPAWRACQAIGVLSFWKEVEPMVLPQLRDSAEILGDEGKSAERVNFVRYPKWSCCLLFWEPHFTFGLGIGIRTVIPE